MAAPAAGAVVLVRFPFSDLTSSKLRPAVVLADAGKGDFILCQITSNPSGTILPERGKSATCCDRRVRRSTIFVA